ncbi:SAV_915 family protein [Streptomyces hainanensis]|uniref:SAV_915 family protein n=1 Tax=Streptomyces hainanensis TaxID=402648 RepID=UPI001FB59AC3|nr:SAV_915 family protein [Streptomyces hainanensis]
MTARLFRTPRGERTAVGFTSERGLVAALGPWQRCVRLSEPALRALVAPLGVHTLTIDPPLVAGAGPDQYAGRPARGTLLAA